jgi:hypothetical protein
MLDLEALEEFDFDFYYIDLEIGLFDGAHYYAYEARTLPHIHLHKLGRISAQHNGLIAGVIEFPHSFRIKAFYAALGHELEVPTHYVGKLYFEKRGG